ncbi:MAG: VWD domain-containing protein, partial [Amphritea sp.]|nr:VWD domain-containing protein [Amphritea sp.]
DHIESFATISDGVAEPTVTAIMNIVSATTESGSHVEIENGFATTDILDDDTDRDIIPLTLGDTDIPIRAFFPYLAFENLSDEDYQNVFDHYYGHYANPRFEALFDLRLSLLFYAKSEPTIWGDPRIATLDGATYDFRMTGEFVLARSTDDALPHPFEVQARYTAIGTSSVATQTTALAAQIGNARISIDLQRDDLLWIDGKAVDVLPYQVVELSGGFLITGNGTYRFSSILGDELTVHFRDGYLDVDIAVSELRAGNMQGLLGNFDGDALNDLQRADGTELGITPDFSALYGGFADDWRVTNSD